MRMSSCWMFVIAWIVAPASFVLAQATLPPEVVRDGYADSIVINGKIVSEIVR